MLWFCSLCQSCGFCSLCECCGFALCVNVVVLLFVSMLWFCSFCQCCGFAVCVNVVVLLFVWMLWFCSLCEWCGFALCVNVVVLLFVSILLFCSVVAVRTAASPVWTLWGHSVHTAVRWRRSPTGYVVVASVSRGWTLYADRWSRIGYVVVITVSRVDTVRWHMQSNWVRGRYNCF